MRRGLSISVLALSCVLTWIVPLSSTARSQASQVLASAPAPCAEDPPLNTTPCARWADGVAFDDFHDQIVLFGGKAGDPDGVRAQVGDTWLFNGTNWFPAPQPPLAHAPCPRHSTRMVYDPVRQNVVLFGGQVDQMPPPPEDCVGMAGVRDDTWIWNGSDWTEVNLGGIRPPARASQGMAWDGVSGKVILFGGFGLCDPAQPTIAIKCGDTWLWDGATSTWSKCLDGPGQQCSSHPSDRSSPALAWHEGRNKVLMFGGTTNSGFNNQTWQWDGSDWTNVTGQVGTAPSGRNGQRMTLDASDPNPNKRLLVMFGGCNGMCSVLDEPGTGELGDTWTIDGGKWKQRSSTGPSPR
jgi:hypothetical protein